MPNFEKHFPKNTRPATRNYLQSMRTGRIGGALRGAGRALGTIGKELMQPSPIREKMIKEHGRYYTMPFGKGGTTISAEKAMGRVRTMPYVDKEKKRAIELMVKRRVSKKKWSPKQKGITAKQLREEAFPELVKELGPAEAKEYAKALQIGEDTNVDRTKYRGGREIRLDEALKDLRRAKNIRKERIPIARQILKSLMVPYEPPSQRGYTQKKTASTHEEVIEEFGPEVGAQFGKRFGVQEPQEDVATTREARKEGTFAQKRGVGIGSSLARTPEARRGQSTLSRLKSFITK